MTNQTHRITPGIFEVLEAAIYPNRASGQPLPGKTGNVAADALAAGLDIAEAQALAFDTRINTPELMEAAINEAREIKALVGWAASRFSDLAEAYDLKGIGHDYIVNRFSIAQLRYHIAAKRAELSAHIDTAPPTMDANKPLDAMAAATWAKRKEGAK